MLRRWLLVALAVASLVVLMYAGIATALSVEVTPEMARANQVPGRASYEGLRALVVPAPEPNLTRGNLLVWGASETGFPSGTREGGMARVLAFVGPWSEANETHVVSFVENGTIVEENVTLDVQALAQGEEGYLVSGDAERDVRFVPAGLALGAVGRFESPASLVAMFSFGGTGFVASLLALILTHKRSGTAGPPPDAAAPCPECRRPVPPGEGFCTACGALLPKTP